MKNIAFALALFVGILWGIAPIFHKVLLRDIGFKTIMVVSSLAYFLCTCIFALVFWKDIVKDSKHLNVVNVSVISLIAIVTGFLANLIYFFVLKGSKSYIVSALIYSSPFFTLIASYLFLKEDITLVGGLGCLLIVMGVVCLAMGDKKEGFFLRGD